MAISDGENLTKGYLVTNFSQKVLPFMFNPTEVPRAHGWGWTKQTVPGRSHRFIGGGAGSDENHNLTLWLDGERGRADRRRAGENVQPSVQGILNDWHSLTLPYDPGLGGAHGTPEPVTLVMGDMLPAVRVVIDNVAERGVFFTRKMETYKAVVSVDFTVLEAANVTSWLFLAERVSEHFLPDAGQIDTSALGGNPLLPDGVVNPFTGS